MAELDEIVQKIMLEGDTEIINKLSEIGSEGFETFKQLAEAAEQGASKMQIFGTTLGLIAASVAGAGLAITHFVEVNDDAIQKTHFLADAFGTTADKLSGIGAAFAQAGVSTQQFENFAQRLVTTIARDWPSIAENVRTAGTQQEAANERVTQSILRIQDAQNNLSRVNDESASKVTNAAIREQEAYLRLADAASEAFATIQHDINNVASANLSLESAEQRLRTLQGNPPSAAEKQALEIKEAQLQVDKARQAAADALRKQQEDQAEAALKQAKLEQEAADASLRRQTAEQEAANARQKAELQLREAVNARAEAEERAAQQQLKNLPLIADALKAVENRQSGLASGIDLTQVSIQNLVKSILLLASEGGKEPTGLKAMSELSKLFVNDTNHVIDAQQRLAIVQQLSQRGMNTTGQSAFELLKVLERGPDVFKNYESASTKAFANTEQARQNVEHFKDAFASLSFSIDLVNRNFAAMASPTVTHFFEAINESLTKEGGLLHALVSGIQAVGEAIGKIIELGHQMFDAIDKAFDLQKGRSFQIFMVAVVALVGAFATAWLAIPALIAVVVTAIGFIAENWDKVKKAGADAWAYIVEKAKPFIDFINSVLDKLQKAWEFAKKVGDALGLAAGNENAASNQNNPAPSTGSEGGSTSGFASGGHIRGRGTSTSDSILARLSDGEYVIKASSVQKFGVGFMNMINAGFLPGFATGGLIGTPTRPSVSPTQASRPLNLTIDGRTFNGLRGPSNVVNDLANFAVARQTSSAGRKPSWVK